ncbi:MAG: AAA family ATPase [Leptospirales bacterium]|nr:AAA family ATPase [Leptospirales bacterium]
MLEEAWLRTLSELKKDSAAKALDPFFHGVFAKRAADQNRLILNVPNARILSHIKTNYAAPIQSRMQSLMGHPVAIEFEINESQSLPAREWLHPRYTLENFYAGTNNRVLLRGILATIESPGRSNPLVIYGPPGSGKTHLVHGFARRCLEQNPNLNILYISGETFRDRYLQSLQTKSAIEFKKEMRSADIFILDDLHAIRVTSPNSREELTHTLSHYLDRGKQVVVTCESAPSELRLEPRLESRILAGLQLAIDPPDQALRLELTERIASEFGIRLTKDLMELISGMIGGGVRELESALGKLHLIQNQGIELTASSVEQYLGAYRSNLKSISLEDVLRIVCARFGVSKADLLGNSRKTEHAVPRHVAMVLAIEHAGLSKSAVARQFQKRDHTTVIHAQKKVKERLKASAVFRKTYASAVEDLCKSPQ